MTDQWVKDKYETGIKFHITCLGMGLGILLTSPGLLMGYKKITHY